MMIPFNILLFMLFDIKFALFNFLVLRSMHMRKILKNWNLRTTLKKKKKKEKKKDF